MPGDFGARSICVFSVMYSPQQMDEVFRECFRRVLPCLVFWTPDRIACHRTLRTPRDILLTLRKQHLLSDTLLAVRT